MQSFSDVLRQVVEQRTSMDRATARFLMEHILQDPGSAQLDVQIAALLAALAVRGVVAAELAGFVDAMRATSVPVPLTDTERDALVDTCGTGGDSSGTFNISTGAALVAAAAGARIAKHGNRRVTSRCGSADVLEALDVPVDLPPERAAECLRQTGFVFLFAPRMHPAMRRVQSLRRDLGFRTVFNVLGPLANPAGARRQVMGVYNRGLLPLIAETMLALGVHHGLVVHGTALLGNGGQAGLDELSLCGPNTLAEVRQGRVDTYELKVEETGMPPALLAALAGGDMRQNAALLRQVFAGAAGPCRDVVVLNAAAALVVAGRAHSLRAGMEQAAAAIDSGAVSRTLAALVEFGRKNAKTAGAVGA